MLQFSFLIATRKSVSSSFVFERRLYIVNLFIVTDIYILLTLHIPSRVDSLSLYTLSSSANILSPQLPTFSLIHEPTGSCFSPLFTSKLWFFLFLFYNYLFYFRCFLSELKMERDFMGLAMKQETCDETIDAGNYIQNCSLFLNSSC